ncbi:MAG: transposase, partial [Acidobacteria bacterium]|nr:transposase [Acidobacteriota bacterium]
MHGLHDNRCERELRPTVIARKVSFGSQSEAGAKTREIMMSLLHT